ncbi:acid phosphatase 1-like [Miscanthus floridulus]|uniref:acid phosphatase 1-like n=1 Tax=Miscanthus floridulus TaxID=154761 RepID=UPI003459FA86
MAARSMMTTSALLATLAVALVLPWLEAAEGAPWFWPPISGDDPYCLTWRVMVEANNAKGWRAVPAQCVGYVRGYMPWGQYYRDVGAVAEEAAAYAAQVAPPAGGNDGRDARVLDVDEAVRLSSIAHGLISLDMDYLAFRAWASRAICPGTPAMQWLFQTLRSRGFRVFLVTGRDEETLGSCTAANLAAAGFSWYDRLIMRGALYRGQSSVAFKSAVVEDFVPGSSISCISHHPVPYACPCLWTEPDLR